MELQVPARYIIDREIARGGIGTVYEARQTGVDGFEKRVAIKLLREDLSHDREFNEGLIAESKLVADLVHENIVQVYQLGRYGTRYYIAMELIDGVTLGAFANRHAMLGRPVPVEIAAFIISRVCRALDYAHGKCGRDGRPLGIVHRDICPNNIMITYGGVVKLGDFGVAKAKGYAPDLEGEVLLGKVRYMSPEQAGFQRTDLRSDLFSLGIVMHEVLTGEPLFLDSSTQRMTENVMFREVRPLHHVRPDVPEQLALMVMKALERDPGRRYQSASDLLHSLEYFMYHDRYGPTNNTLRDYVAEVFEIGPGGAVRGAQGARRQPASAGGSVQPAPEGNDDTVALTPG